jgi:D-alanyl-lipoteichoic acid acyltransferase DltB (MBOAT superfamily)
VADRLGIYVDAVYGNAYHHSSMTFVLATFFFAFQIYCDFAGYSNIARGLAKLMGFEVMINFNLLILLQIFKSFGKDGIFLYLRGCMIIYLSLLLLAREIGGNWGVIFALLVTFIACGFWHGAAWTFVSGELCTAFILQHKNHTRQVK